MAAVDFEIMRRAQVARLPKIFRYGAASVVTTLASLLLLAVILIWLTPGWANLIAVTAGSVISFELNRRWVWKRSSPTVRFTQLALFVCTSLTFLALSTVAVHEVSGAIGSDTEQAVRAMLIEATTVAVYGVRWVVQFFLLDRLFFRSASSTICLAPR